MLIIHTHDNKILKRDCLVTCSPKYIPSLAIDRQMGHPRMAENSVCFQYLFVASFLTPGSLQIGSRGTRDSDRFHHKRAKWFFIYGLYGGQYGPILFPSYPVTNTISMSNMEAIWKYAYFYQIYCAKIYFFPKNCFWALRYVLIKNFF